MGTCWADIRTRLKRLLCAGLTTVVGMLNSSAKYIVTLGCFLFQMAKFWFGKEVFKWLLQKFSLNQHSNETPPWGWVGKVVKNSDIFHEEALERSQNNNKKRHCWKQITIISSHFVSSSSEFLYFVYLPTFSCLFLCASPSAIVALVTLNPLAIYFSFSSRWSFAGSQPHPLELQCRTCQLCSFI